MFWHLAQRESAYEKQVREEEKILESVAERTGYSFLYSEHYTKLHVLFVSIALMAATELAKGIQYSESLRTG